MRNEIKVERSGRNTVLKRVGQKVSQMNDIDLSEMTGVADWKLLLFRGHFKLSCFDTVASFATCNNSWMRISDFEIVDTSIPNRKMLTCHPKVATNLNANI